MYDSVTPTDIPLGAEMVAGYVDGYYAWSQAGWDRFPNAVKVRIAVLASTNDGHVLDVETGDATPAEAVDWVLMRRAAGADPSVYVQLSRRGEIAAAFDGRGVPGPHIWIASWDGNADVPQGYQAHQYANPALSGGHFDLSAVLDYWPGVDFLAPIPSPPVPPVAPSPPSPQSGGFSVSEFAYVLAQLQKLAAAANVQLDPLPPVPEPVLPPAPPAPAPAGPRTYTVVPGDSLSEIALHYLGNGNRWPEIYNMNRAEIGDNPNLIHPGQVLELPLS